MSIFASVITCGDPGTVANGQRDATAGTAYGATLTFSCNEGYRLLGNAVRRCEESGQWSGSQPTCNSMKRVYV